MDLETLRRTLIRRMESDRRFGMTHLPPAKGDFDLSFIFDADPTAAAAGQPAKAHSAAATASIANVPSAATARTPASLDRVPAGLPLGANITPPNESPSTLSRDERVRELAVLNQRVAGCTRCEELAATRTQTVFGVGNPEAAILFLGEAPGADEDRVGEPFVGKAGQLLNRIIAACRLTRDDIYIANVLKCRPPGNRNPTPIEAENCFEYLSKQISLVDPDYIVCWGRIAAERLLNTKESIGRLRRNFFPYGRAKVSVTYHPSYLLRNPAAKKDVWEDMKWLFRDMGVDLDPRKE